jgi:ubiquinone/menaquinone biosynthesis C-methylase UbiE
MTPKDVHGSKEVWEEVFKGNDVVFSENPQTQNQLFDLTKINFLEEILGTGKKKMLEVGAGSAYVSLYFAKRGFDCTCLDINAPILKIAEKNFEKENAKGKFVVGTAEKLPFKDNSFDIVSSFGLMEHFADPLPAFREMIRVLKPGGLFFADIVPNRFSVQSLGNIFNFLVTFPFSPSKAMRNFRPLYFESNLTWADYKKLIEDAGIKNLKVRGNRPWPRLTLPRALDKIYTIIMKPSLSLWKKFDRWDSGIAKWWGAGLWFWGIK